MTYSLLVIYLLISPSEVNQYKIDSMWNIWAHPQELLWVVYRRVEVYISISTIDFTEIQSHISKWLLDISTFSSTDSYNTYITFQIYFSPILIPFLYSPSKNHHHIVHPLNLQASQAGTLEIALISSFSSSNPHYSQSILHGATKDFSKKIFLQIQSGVCYLFLNTLSNCPLPE